MPPKSSVSRQELHDETLQSLATLRIGLASADRDGGSDALQEAVRAAVDQLECDIANVRALIAELRPPGSGLIVDAAVDVACESGRAAGMLQIHADRIAQLGEAPS